ncbi:SLATT domain-containing protein [Streptomyces sp. NPDC003688]
MEAADQADEAQRRKAIETEFRRLEESAMYSAQMQFEQTKQWRSVNLALGLPATTLAAVAGTTALAESTGRIAAGILALVSAGFGAVLTTVNASHRMNQAAAAANAYLEIQTAARQAREIDLLTWSPDEARAALAELTARRDEQNKTAEPPNRRSYRKAKVNIQSGGQSYAVDETHSHQNGR